MDRYMRAYRDPKSPLTPLTPLGALSAFTFNINEATTTTTPQQCATPTNTPSSALAAGIIQNTLRATLGERFSKDFQRIRNIFEQKSGGRGNSARRQQRGTANARTQQQQQQTQFINGVRIKKEKKEDKENEEEEDDEDEANNERFMTAMGDSKIFLDVPRQRRKNATTTTPSRTPQQQHTQKQPPKRSFLQASPIAPKPLSPRIATLLEQAGAANLKGLFQREEIDSTVLRLMKPEDLKYLGIEDEEDIRRIRGLITGAWNFVRTLKEQK